MQINYYIFGLEWVKKRVGREHVPLFFNLFNLFQYLQWNFQGFVAEETWS